VVKIRSELEHDAVAIERVLRQAFPSGAEAALVEVLRGRTEPQISLVAEHEQGGVVGHVLFTPVGVDSGSPDARVLGLGPMAVSPDFQRGGVGTALVEAGLAACRAAGGAAVVVLGHPAYYPRFGFRPAWDFGLYYAVAGREPAFLARELVPGALRGVGGRVVYHEAFRGL
jgi:putative acetyltransferase